MNIIVIDDDPLVVQALTTILNANDFNIVAKGYSGIEAINLYKKYNPDLILLDIRMSDMNGIEATKNILEYNPLAKILLITTFNDEEYISKAILLGCKGYILKDNISGIIPAINAIFSGNLVFDSNVIDNINLNNKNRNNNHFDLYNISKKEIELILLVCEGYNNKEISKLLFLSEGTVRNYLSNVLNKLDLRDRTQLVVWYYKNII